MHSRLNAHSAYHLWQQYSMIRIAIVNINPFSAFSFFFFNDPATTEIYTLSLHDALPISRACAIISAGTIARSPAPTLAMKCPRDRKSTRLNSSHVKISYAVFCLKKKKKKNKINIYENKTNTN